MLTGFVDGLNVRCERKRGLNTDFKVVALNNKKGEIIP